MKKRIISFLLLLFCSSVLFASGIEGKWTATIETDNGPFTFYAEYVVKGEVITGTLYNDQGSIEISNGKINGDEFEYTFELDYNKFKHTGKLVAGKLKIKSSGDYGESEFTLTRVKKE
jgi:hypothetical protein